MATKALADYTEKLKLHLYCCRIQKFVTDMSRADPETFVHNSSFVVGDMSPIT